MVRIRNQEEISMIKRLHSGEIRVEIELLSRIDQRCSWRYVVSRGGSVLACGSDLQTYPWSNRSAYQHAASELLQFLANDDERYYDWCITQETARETVFLFTPD